MTSSASSWQPRVGIPSEWQYRHAAKDFRKEGVQPHEFRGAMSTAFDAHASLGHLGPTAPMRS
jgi:hypothetical protein